MFKIRYYRNAAGILIVYDVTNPDSFVNTKRWIEEVKNNCGDDGVAIVLVGNKCDAPNKVIEFKDQEDYAKSMHLKFFEASAKENINIDEIFFELTRQILSRQQAAALASKSSSTQNKHKDDDKIKIDGDHSKRSKKKPCCN